MSAPPMSAPCGGVTFLTAGLPDSGAVAALHAASWRAHYRGSLSDAYLDGPIEEERRAAWAERLAAPSPVQIVVLAREGGGLVGFACAFVDADPAWGTLIDNLHVTAARKGGGIGRALMGEIGRRIGARAPRSPVHLFALDANHGARAFYRRIGGQEAGRERHDLPDGSQAPVIRFLWPSPADLVAAASAR